MSVSATVDTSQNVLLPIMPELYDAGFLDILLPPSQQDGTQSSMKTDIPTNPMIDALKANASRTLTDNSSPAFSSTGSATLDAFGTLKPYSSRKTLYPLLEKAWAEEPDLTIRMIWNCRSIHDGKGDRETFYR